MKTYLSIQIEKLIDNSQYEQAANEFLNETKAKIEFGTPEFKNHFADDKEPRFVFPVTITRGNRKMSFDFGSSIADTMENIKHVSGIKGNFKTIEQLLKCAKTEKQFEEFRLQKAIKENKIKNPSNYDILACLNKSDFADFADFCDCFGYDTDSKSAEKIHIACQKEFKDLQSLFNDKEIEALQQIN